MSEVQFQPSRSRALRQRGFGFAAFAVVAVFASLFWINRTDSEAQEPLPTSGTPVSAERRSSEIAPAGNEIAWGFSDRWFPLIQAVPPSMAVTGLQSSDAAPVAEFVPTSGEERSTLGPTPDVQRSTTGINTFASPSASTSRGDPCALAAVSSEWPGTAECFCSRRHDGRSLSQLTCAFHRCPRFGWPVAAGARRARSS